MFGSCTLHAHWCTLEEHLLLLVSQLQIKQSAQAVVDMYHSHEPWTHSALLPYVRAPSNAMPAAGDIVPLLRQQQQQQQVLPILEQQQQQHKPQQQHLSLQNSMQAEPLAHHNQLPLQNGGMQPLAHQHQQHQPQPQQLPFQNSIQPEPLSHQQQPAAHVSNHYPSFVQVNLVFFSFLVLCR